MTCDESQDDMHFLDPAIESRDDKIDNSHFFKIPMHSGGPVRSVNTELIKLNWSIGKSLVERQKIEQWGSKYLEQISRDLQAEFPQATGFSVRNLKYVRNFSKLYMNVVIGQQPVAQLPWGHIIQLIQSVKYNSIREWYAEQSLKNNWSREGIWYDAHGVFTRTNFPEILKYLPHWLIQISWAGQ